MTQLSGNLSENSETEHTLKGQASPTHENLQLKNSDSAEDIVPITLSHNNNQLTLATIITIVIPEQDGSMSLDFHEAYRTNPITFEEFFAKSKTQRRFITNVLTFQLIVNFAGVLASFFCTFLTDRLWFYEAEDDLLNALLLHTVILSTMMLLFPFLTYKLRKHSPGIVTKCILEALVRVYQASLFTFWFAFGLGKIFKSSVSNETKSLVDFEQSRSRPLFFLPLLYYLLTTSNELAIIAFLRLTQIQLRHINAILISFGVSGIFLIFVLPLILTTNIGRGFVMWELAQILGAVIFSVIDGSLNLCSFRKLWTKTKKSSTYPSEINVQS